MKFATLAIAASQVAYGLLNTTAGVKASVDLDVIRNAKDAWFDSII